MSFPAALVWKIQQIDSVDNGGPGTIGGRVYPELILLDSKVYPYVTYKVEDVATIQTYDTGPGNPFRSATVTLNCVSPDYLTAQAVADELIGTATNPGLDNTSGSWGPWDVTGATSAVQGVFLESATDEYDQLTETEQSTLYLKVVTFTACYVDH
jgi:hypothetical protein